ncbi:hypothetical protein L0F63_000849, partial [Massospora cicadina]
MLRYGHTPKDVERQPTTATELSNLTDRFEFDHDFKSVLNFAEPVHPKLDLDMDKRALLKKNRQAIQFKSTPSSKDLDDPDEVEKAQEKAPSFETNRPTNTSPSRRFNPVKLINRLQPKKSRARHTVSNYPTAGALFNKARTGFPLASATERPLSEYGNRLNLAKPHSSDEATKRRLCGFYVRKTSVTLSSQDFDTMLFHEETPTLKLSLTPNWLHFGL